MRLNCQMVLQTWDGIPDHDRNAVLYFRQSLMFALITRLLTLSFVLAGSANAASSFHASQSRINYGESCTLTWSSTADEAYIVGVGKVEGTGSVQVAPAVSTDYVLVVNGTGRIEY